MEEEQAKTEEQKVVHGLQQKKLVDYFGWRPLPWWLCFFLGIFFLTKLQVVYNDSPCAVLGTQSPVTMSDIKRAFRGLSMCTHPDRLRGRLKREPTQAEERRGEIIFNRASAAKDELTKVLKSRKKAQSVECYEGELEMALLQVVSQAGRGLTTLGIADYFGLVVDLAWNMITFEFGIVNTLLSVLWLAFVFKLFKQFFMYLWSMGIIRFILGLLTSVIIGPFPTVINFVCLPFVRLFMFAMEVAGAKRPESTDDAPASDQAEDVDGHQSLPADTPVTFTAANAAAKALAARQARDDLPQRNIRQRKKKETDEEREKRNKDLLTGQFQATPTAASQPINHGAGPRPEGIFSIVRWSHKEPMKARQEAADAVQFDLLLILTKPVIPLCMLVSLGQVWNGLISSIFIGHALRRWVPKMTYEAHHLLCCFFGVVHTLLGVSAQQVEDFSNREDRKVLHLAWAWSFKDVLAVMHMCLLGSTVTAAAALGNEPAFATSFAAGIALRIAIAQDSVRGLQLMKLAASWLETGLHDLGVKLESAEEVVAYSGHGIGDCGGGPFRMLFGDGSGAHYAALTLKAWLMMMPLLATLQWANRSYQAGKMLGKKWKFSRLTRIGQRAFLCTLGILQCYLIANVELNASNGALANFWVAMLIGAVGESLLSTYDIRGPVRQIVFLLLFIAI